MALHLYGEEHMEKNRADRILAIIERETGLKVDFPEALDTLEIDSLDFICLIKVLREEVGPLSDSDAMNATTIGELVAAIQERPAIQ